MLGHERTRRHRIFEITGYIFLAIFVAAGTVALVFYARGYYYNPRSGQIVQNGLVLLSSEPVEADVYLDGEATGKQTQWRSTLKVGEYTIALRRDGYREWRRTFELEAGEVLWLSYPLLIPQSLASREVTRLVESARMSVSPDSSRLIVANGQTLTILPTDTPDESQITVNLPDRIGELPGRVREMVWSDTNDQVLVTISDGKTPNQVFVQIGRRNATPRLVSSVLSGYSDVRFVPESDSLVYGLRDKQLWRIDTSGEQEPVRIAEQVDKYAAYDAELLTWEAASQRVIYHRGSQSLALNIEAVGDVADLVLGRHEGRAIAALTSPTMGTIILHRPAETGEKIIRNAFVAKKLLMDIGANYVAAYSGKDFRVYDVERTRFHEYSLPATTVSQIRWATGGHFTAVADGQAIIFDFTGDNLQRLGGATPYPVVLSPDQSHILHGATSSVDKHPMLVATSLATN